MSKTTTTIFRQLILNVIIPVVAALLLLGVLNFQNARSLLQDANVQKNQVIADEIQNIMIFQDEILDIIEENLNKRVSDISNKMIEKFEDTKDIANADLLKLQLDVGMIPGMEDIYIIDVKTGIIVNTTFDKDKNLNVFNFGESYKNYLLDIAKNRKFISEGFTPETSTYKLKKYTYAATKDGKYIIETGHYSEKVNYITSLVKKRFDLIKKKDASIAFAGLYISADDPVDLNSGEIIKKLDGRKKCVLEAFADKQRKSYDTIIENKNLHYDFIYMERKNTTLYKSSVIAIGSDRSAQIRLLRFELIKSLLIFGLTLFVVIFLIYKKTKTITMPVKKLVNNVLRITAGNLEERAEVEGRNEITTLSEKFNEMLAKIEEYYAMLEEKVRQRTAEILKQKDQIEEQKKRITDSIIYAKRIQDAILPPEPVVINLLKEAFVLYKPKEIVSGDFYWMTEHNNKIIVAAVDCTGHGVPGAFMSMLGYAFLNEIVSKAKEFEAGDILFKLRSNVVESLRQTDDVKSSKDGMDISLCIIDFNTMKMQWAGANNPLYIFRHASVIKSENFHEKDFHPCDSFTEIKADKMPIGITRKGCLPFTTHKIDIAHGDVIYIFSDGFADQFGGPEQWKFMYSNFKKLLAEIHKKPAEEQKQILNLAIEDWKSGAEQTDDILVIGIKI